MIPKFTKILFPTDLSEHARYSFQFAASLAAHYKAGIVILHVLEGEASESTRSRLSVFLGSEKMKELEENQEEHAASARDILIGKRREADVVRDAIGMFYQDAKNELAQYDIPADEIIVKKGDAVSEIMSAVQKYGCDLIVMGHGKYSSLAERVLGSTAKSILRKSKVPVLVIPSTAK